jgi:pimeloyl-ACP methyl ester carboxylesterase
MLADPQGNIDFRECGRGPTIVLVPGSCSTGVAWRPVIAALGGNYRCVTTSLPGYGGTAERRTAHDRTIARVALVVEAVVSRAATPVHLVGHSFGGLAALSVALRERVPLASVMILEPPAVTLLDLSARDQHYALAFRQMTTEYFATHASGNREAISAMIDFYGGAGTFASWPARVRGYAIETTPVNFLDWQSAYDFEIPISSMTSVKLPTLVARGSKSHPGMQRITEILAGGIPNSSLATLEGAAHFMISTHPDDVARLIAKHVDLPSASVRCPAVEPPM